ncbi:hypothetical protein PGT21_013081 [Puccinia graminis f. sp. tritici]|uniref:Uncharacterized protein n=1 Tax=Puccinia graminis f. sp. tritici TaxID=56615 RepID=A0A5B0RQ45_PUCGR|nr:hypothetical protein PGT21_013081 [Puccinia graminis f. sp. tritici]KAA1126774.1 hypothetical protein PGTUg99_018578 [Puccinia graminis f. sp. tritici]
MSYLWSDLSHDNPPSSPVPGPSTSNNRRRLKEQDDIHEDKPEGEDIDDDNDQENENNPLGAYPTPPVSEQEPFVLPRKTSRPRNRLRTGSSSVRTFPRTYRQATLSECLNRCASSPLGGRSTELESFDDFNHSNDLPEHQSNQRPTLAPLLFDKDRRLAKRVKVVDTSLDETPSGLLPPFELHQRPTSDFGYPEPSPSLDRPFRTNRSRIIQPARDLLDFELAYKRSDVEPRRMKRMESLRSDPETQTIKMWNPEYENGHEFPFSLCFNHAAKAGDSGRPPAPGELMAAASALGTISLFNPSLRGSIEDLMPIATFQALQNGIFALSFSPSDLMLATGSGAQVSEIFDVETGTVLSRLQDHMGTVKTVEFSSFNENIVVTGSRDGSIKIWDLRITGAQNTDDGSHFHPAVITIRNAHDEKYAGRKRRKGVHIPSVSSVLWSRIADHQLFSAGSANGVVKLWDVRKKTPFASKAHPLPLDQSVEQSNHAFPEEDYEHAMGFDNPQRPHGISSLVASSDGARLYSLGTDSTIRTHDGLHLSRPPHSQLSSFKHPNMIATSLYLKLCLSSDDRYLGCSSSTGEIFIWDTRPTSGHAVLADQEEELDPPGLEIFRDGHGSRISNRPSEPVLLPGHTKEVCGLDFWRQGLGSCSDDSSIRIWSYSDANLPFATDY